MWLEWRWKCELKLEERDMAQWLERGALPMSLSAVRFWIPLGAGFSGKYHVSPLSILGHCFDVVLLGKALNPQMLHMTQVKMSTCRYDIDGNVYDKFNAPNGCSTVCSPWSWDGTWMNRSSDQGVKCKSRMRYLISDIYLFFRRNKSLQTCAARSWA